MTQAGNVTYNGPEDLPDTVPVFPLTGALLLPRGTMPLNIFEPRYLAMVEAAMRSNRLIGIVQPTEKERHGTAPELNPVGCLGRVAQYAETGDGRLLVNLVGIVRFRILAEVDSAALYRCCRIDTAGFAVDFVEGAGQDDVDRKGLIATFHAFVDAHDLQVDWGSIDRASNETLVNSLSMMAPYGSIEKQALLEAASLRERAEILVAVTELSLSGGSGSRRSPLQ
ncbi:MAG: LON peptidase substrate-binding domain-containing protein [Ancalomicrobiaceae bacterium]|nr:LON peptidase substrate-binding domain-containing protein [Ancalomicrobiaceae bacterium]